MIEFLQILSILVVAGYIVIVFQVFSLYRELRSQAWMLLVASFVITCGLRFWSFVRLPFAVQRLESQGRNVWEVLTWEVWTQLILVYVTIGLTIMGLHLLHRDLEYRLHKTGIQ